jgi:hypothetical protein
MRSSATVLMIGRLEYALSPFEDVAELKRALVAAVRDGCGLVNFRANGDVEVFALIMPGITVVIEEREVEVPDASDEPPNGPGADDRTDFDMY